MQQARMLAGINYFALTPSSFPPLFLSITEVFYGTNLALLFLALSTWVWGVVSLPVGFLPVLLLHLKAFTSHTQQSQPVWMEWSIIWEGIYSRISSKSIYLTYTAESASVACMASRSAHTVASSITASSLQTWHTHIHKTKSSEVSDGHIWGCYCWFRL